MIMSNLAEKLSTTDYRAHQLAEEKKAREIREMNDAAQEFREIAQLEEGGGTAEVDPTLRDHYAEAREAAIERKRNAAALNTLAGKTLEPGEEEFRKARVRDFENALGETMDRFGEAEPENRDFLDDSNGSQFRGRPVALCRKRYIGNECWNTNRSILQTEKNLARLSEELTYRLKRFDGAEVDDVKIQNAVQYGEDLASQHDMWTDFMAAACNIHFEETNEEWKPFADTIPGKEKTQAAKDARALITRWGKKTTPAKG
jgi:hypothetical protein